MKQSAGVNEEYTTAAGEKSFLSIYMQNASFSWAHRLQNTPTLNLNSIKLGIPKGSKALIIGEVYSSARCFT